jgi:hypothetical protein
LYIGEKGITVDKVRALVAGALAATTVAACSSSGGSGGPSGGGGSGNFCQRLAVADRKLTHLGSALGNPQNLGNRLSPVISAFQSLKSGAPPKVSAAIDDLLTAMQEGQKALNGGNPQAAEKQMMKLAPKLQHDATTIGTYVSQQCGSGGG